MGRGARGALQGMEARVTGELDARDPSRDTVTYLDEEFRAP